MEALSKISTESHNIHCARQIVGTRRKIYKSLRSKIYLKHYIPTYGTFKGMKGTRNVCVCVCACARACEFCACMRVRARVYVCVSVCVCVCSFITATRCASYNRLLILTISLYLQ